METHTAEEMDRTLRDFQKVKGSALIIGGVAVIYHGYRRYTHDIDVLYAARDGGILRRLDPDFKVVRRAESGWHHLEHRQTGVRLELVPEGGLTTYGFIPGPAQAGAQAGFVSLAGLLWLKLLSGRAQDDADVVALYKVRGGEFAAGRRRIPAGLRARLKQLMARARRELESDPYRQPGLPAEPGAGEAAGPYPAKPRRRAVRAPGKTRKVSARGRRPRPGA